MISPLTVIAAVWLVWIVGWWVSSTWTARTVERASGASQLRYSIFIWAAGFLLLSRSRVLGPLLRPFMPHFSSADWVGAALVLAGLGFTVWARVHLGRLWSGVVALKSEHRVVRSGPYAIVRHPIYTGLLIALAGTAIARDNWAALAALVLATVGFTLKLRQEERLLLHHLGAEYEAYMEKTRALIPLP
ncbi:MAG: methyltransferase family protein [Gemmatimonadaceae bacterium]